MRALCRIMAGSRFCNLSAVHADFSQADAVRTWLNATILFLRPKVGFLPERTASLALA